MGFASGDDPGAILDQYLSGEELEELILEEENIFDSDLSRTLGPHGLMPSMMIRLKNIKNVFEYLKCIL